MKMMFRLAVVVLTIYSLASCRKTQVQPRIERIHEIRALSIDPEKTKLEVSLEISNPNSYNLTLEDLNLDLYSRERIKLGTASLSRSAVIPRRSSTGVTFIMDLHTRTTVKQINQQTVSIFTYVQGRGTASALGLRRAFEFEEPFELDVREQVRSLFTQFSSGNKDLFRVKRAYVRKVGLLESVVEVEFIMLNPFGLRYRLGDLPSRITIGDQDAGSGSLDDSLTFDENIYSRDGKLVFRVDNIKSLLNALKGVVNGEIDYQVLGEVKMDAYGMKMSQPFRYRDKIEVNLTEYLFQ